MPHFLPPPLSTPVLVRREKREPPRGVPRFADRTPESVGPPVPKTQSGRDAVDRDWRRGMILVALAPTPGGGGDAAANPGSGWTSRQAAAAPAVPIVGHWATSHASSPSAACLARARSRTSRDCASATASAAVSHVSPSSASEWDHASAHPRIPRFGR